MIKYITADDEFPDCGKCHNTKCSTGEHCGPKYGWSGYFRTVDLGRTERDEEDLYE